MSEDHISKKRVVYEMPGTEAVSVRRDVELLTVDGSALAMDVYSPSASTRVPAVVMVAGFPDGGYERIVGRKYKDIEQSVSWGRLMAASGMVAIAYTNHEPAADVHALLRHLRQNAASLGIDENAIGVFAVSGHAPLALSLLFDDRHVKCAALCYPFLLDLDGATAVADAAKTFGFVNPAAGKSVDDLPKDVPLFIARAGQDQIPHLIETLDRFVARALAANLSITVVNHATAPHAFDLYDDSATSREIVRRILAFLRFHLVGASVC